MNKSSKSKPVLISVIIITAAVGWIAHRLWDGFDEVLAAISSLEPGFLLLSIVPAMISVFIAAYLYFLVLVRSVPKPPPLAHVMGHFIISQVVRHLPGKIWGVFYQANAMTKWVEARATVQANIEHYALMNYNSIAMAISVFALLQYGTTVAMVIFSVALLLLFVALRLSLLKRIVSIIIKITTRSKESMDRSIENKHNLLIVALLQVDWFFYFLTCLIILPAYFSLKSAVIIGSCYAIAWLLGAMTIVMPGGLFVREASFLWVVGFFGFDPADMFIFSIVARTLFTLVDVICAVVSCSLIREQSGVLRA